MKTSLYSILCIVIRLGALELFVTTLTGFPFWMRSLGADQYGAGGTGMVVGISGALVALAVLLWLYPGVIARLAAARSSQESFESPIAPSQLQYIAFAVLGVAFAMNALLDLVAVVGRIGMTSQVSDIAVGALIRRDEVALVVQVLKLALGVGLAFGARGLVGWLEQLRERGLPPVQPESNIEVGRSSAD
jgi:hypothetical protein